MWKRREAKAVYSPRRYHIARYVASSQEELTWLKKPVLLSRVPPPPVRLPPPPGSLTVLTARPGSRCGRQRQSPWSVVTPRSARLGHGESRSRPTRCTCSAAQLVGNSDGGSYGAPRCSKGLGNLEGTRLPGSCGFIVTPGLSLTDCIALEPCLI